MDRKRELYIDQVELDRQFLLEHERDPVWTGERVQRLILSQPAVDAVRVVRCRDCKVPHNKYTGCPKLRGVIMPSDGFCPYGEGEQLRGFNENKTEQFSMSCVR